MLIDPMTRWKNKLNDSTWRAYDSWWNGFLAFVKATPEELILLNVMDATDLAESYYLKLKNEGYSSNSCACALYVVKSFFAYNGLRLAKSGNKFKGRTTIEQHTDITQKNVYDLIQVISSPRYKAAVGLCFSGGQRDGLVCALKFKYIATKEWWNAEVVVFDIPDFVPNAKGENVNKRNVKYRFGVLADVAQWIKMHMDERVDSGENITGDSWLLRSTYHGSEIKPIYQDYLNKLIHKAATRVEIQSFTNGQRKCGFGNTKLGRYAVHGHSGRSYFKTQMRLSGVDPELRDFMMGHVTSMDGAYDRYNVKEVTDAIKLAKSRLAITPESVDDLDKRKQGLQDSLMLLKGMMTPEQFDGFKVAITKASTSVELENAVSAFTVKAVH